ncbi:hypothetical protein BWQ96_04617 [Gracilariopsis chorda]|uniref:Uncharacterized protein n=1 Tax=Gracilariopsis chorda TaxID=448386 RepID=A0A2V3IU27_9FLOR|nr:hypothetical protein BWQ96_04617 [Gracilariopsis chorda]|eukprot:PXF45612.1 hypothetical protein BWQ96_04617 [Gracilariopsis chorda]
MQAWELYSTPNAAPSGPQTTVAIEHVNPSLEAHTISIDKTKPWRNRMKNHERVAYTINLEDAVSTLKDIKTQDILIGDTPMPLADTATPAHIHTTAGSNHNDKDAGRRGAMMTRYVDFRNRNEGLQ